MSSSPSVSSTGCSLSALSAEQVQRSGAGQLTGKCYLQTICRSFLEETEVRDPAILKSFKVGSNLTLFFFFFCKITNLYAGWAKILVKGLYKPFCCVLPLSKKHSKRS